MPSHSCTDEASHRNTQVDRDRDKETERLNKYICMYYCVSDSSTKTFHPGGRRKGGKQDGAVTRSDKHSLLPAPKLDKQ